MPKSKSRSNVRAKSHNRGAKASAGGNMPKYGTNIGQTSRRTNLIAGTISMTVAVAGAYYWWTTNQASNRSEEVVETLALEGQVALADVRSVRDQGNGHLSPGQTKNYPEPFPTSGDHSATPANAGFYSRELPKVNLLHAMEHGNVVIYYDTPGDEAIELFKEWGSLYGDFWAGVVINQSAGLGEAIVLTAWTKVLRLDAFDAATSAAFLDQYRGRGPENQVR